MEEVKIEYFKYLPTEERRQAAKRLKKYMEYFQAELSAIENRSKLDMDRIESGIQRGVKILSQLEGPTLIGNYS